MPSVTRIPRKPSGATVNGDSFYQSPAWNMTRKAHYSDPDNALCYYCGLGGIVRLGPICDHFRPRRLYPELSHDFTNLRSACPHCDSKKRLFEKGIATKEQFEQKIGPFINETFCKSFNKTA